MKKLLFTIASVLILCTAFCQSKKSEAELHKFTFVKCISGDCQNGKGVAQFLDPDLDKNINSDTVIYNGNFIAGQMSGQGIKFNKFDYYIGNFQNNYYRGYGTSFNVININNQILPDSTTNVEFLNYDEDGCSIGLIYQREERYMLRNSSKGNSKHKTFWGFSSSDAEKDEWILQHVKALHASSTKVYTTEVEMGNNITHAVKDIYLADGKYSEVFNTDMIGTLAQGYKKYFVCVNSTKFAKRYHEPFGVSYFFQLINDNNQVVNQQIKESSLMGNACCNFEILPDGKYTIQVAYDYHNVSSGGERLNALKLEFTLYSHDFIYRKFMKN